LSTLKRCAPRSTFIFAKRLLKPKEKTLDGIEKFRNGADFGEPFNGFPLVIAWKLSNDSSAFFTEYGVPIFAIIVHGDMFASEFAASAVRAFGVHSLIVG
jgi:hypothetical protein